LFLGKIAANQNLSGLVVKLAREKGSKAREERAGVVGVVTRDGKPVDGGRVGAWQRLRDLDRINVAVRRGRTSFRGGYEFAWSRVGPDGKFAVEGLKPGPWYFAYEEPGQDSTVLGPIELKKGDHARTVDIAFTPGASIEGRVEHVPSSMAGMIWVVAFDGAVVTREARVAPDGTFRLEGLPPGRYGLKAGHDAYEDPHSLMGRFDFQKHREHYDRPAEPWRGAVVVEVQAGATAKGAVLDFRPPEPLFLLEPDEKEEKPSPP
jgi:hypothetical protein